MKRLTLVPLILLVGTFASNCAIAADGTGPNVTRADLATSYLRLEQAWAKSDLSAQETADANRAFDRATLAFFQGDFGDAIRVIDELAVSLMPHLDTEAAKKAAAVRVRLDPPFYVTGSPVEHSIHVETLYPIGEDGTQLHSALVLISDSGEVLAKQSFNLMERPGMNTQLVFSWSKNKLAREVALSDLAPGRYTLAVAFGDDLDIENLTEFYPSTTFSVVTESLDSVRERNAKHLESTQPLSLAAEQALASVKARNALLADTPDPSNTAQLVLDPVVLAREIAAEIETLDAGGDPFKGRKGDYWRVLKTEDKEIPMRVYMPPSASTDIPLAVVIAFHGAGGDENMFVDAYGAGIIKRLADEHGFLLVSPLTYAFNGPKMGEYFDVLLDSLSANYSIDRAKIYVTGHSMGGGATANLLNQRAEKIAAAAALCGFRALTADPGSVPPTLVVAAELDPLARPARLEAEFKKCQEAGMPVEYKFMKNYGHTLVVGEILPEAIAWMLRHTR